MPKRKSEGPVDSDPGSTRRSTRLRTSTASVASIAAPASAVTPSKTTKKTGRKTPQQKTSAAKQASADAVDEVEPKPKSKAKKSKSGSTPETLNANQTNEQQYWLLKAEPETRLENGVDVKFSIDDLAARTDPEPWDGIRNYAARNNLRGMKKGDRAFFYHSNCKEPGIVGTMEIVQEHTPDLSAHDPKAPYYDASSKPDDPKWSVVHVRFRSKFATPITLKQLREMGGQGRPLENMQMLKLTRMSVSKVSAAEWEHLMGLAKELPA